MGGPLAGATLEQQAGVSPEGAATVSSVHGRTPRGWPRGALRSLADARAAGDSEARLPSQGGGVWA